jgi:thioredoxin-dependent peroxiredoxin
VDDPETNRKFAESLQADYPILSDPGKSVARAFGVVTDERAVAFRWTFYIGVDGRILHVDRDVKAATAGADIAVQLAALGVATR